MSADRYPEAAEKSLLLATRNRLISVAGYTSRQCAIEADDDAPATTGDLYVIVGPQGYRPGPRNGSSGFVSDLVFSIGVFVALRITAVPRDRHEMPYVLGTQTINKEIEKVLACVDWQWGLTSAANTLLTAETGTTYGFMHPLVFESVDAKPRILPGEFFGASNEAAAGMGRLVRFGGARRIVPVV